ncbi:MAG: helix-turn-helix transcriptional regulator [Nannocystis sp.]|nr:helix-turn-helix transcriptional regulator [Nannocystis sp.]MBA3545593.1 helix-turn-helix transcriptional regulator [Nannocystis sp.]
MTQPRKKTSPASKREHIGADVMAYFRERAAKDPEFAAASREEADKLQLAHRIRELREAKKLSQAQLAEMIETKQPSIARIESGRTLPRLDVLQRIATALGMRLTIDFVKVPAPRRRRAKTAVQEQTSSWAGAEVRPSLR